MNTRFVHAIVALASSVSFSSHLHLGTLADVLCVIDVGGKFISEAAAMVVVTKH